MRSGKRRWFQSCMVRPTTRRPSRWRRPATAELSTPPDMATATTELLAFTAGVSGREAAQVAGRSGDGVDERVHFLKSISAAEGEAQAGAGAGGREAHGEQDVRRLDGAARTGRAAGDGEAFEVERDDHGLAFDAVEADVGGVGDAAVARSVDAGVGDAGEHALFEEVAQI